MSNRILMAVVMISCHYVVFPQEAVTNSIGMQFILVKPGKMVVGRFQPPYPVPEDTVKGAERPYMMWMGDGRNYNQTEFALAREFALRDSRDGFEVTIEHEFYIGKFEVTQGQWKAVMGSNPSRFSHGNHPDSLPVESVSWKDAQKFLRKLNKRDKKYAYRLPTEFEWEYAARAGAKDDIPWEKINASANLNKTHTVPVGSKLPNAWGLFDMLGNTWEWVDDFYNGRIFADPIPPKKGKQHVLKGASFVGDVKNATYMTHAGGPGNGWDVGFRVVMEIK